MCTTHAVRGSEHNKREGPSEGEPIEQVGAREPGAARLGRPRARVFGYASLVHTGSKSVAKPTPVLGIYPKSTHTSFEKYTVVILYNIIVDALERQSTHSSSLVLQTSTTPRSTESFHTCTFNAPCTVRILRHIYPLSRHNIKYWYHPCRAGLSHMSQQ